MHLALTWIQEVHSVLQGSLVTSQDMRPGEKSLVSEKVVVVAAFLPSGPGRSVCSKGSSQQ